MKVKSRCKSTQFLSQSLFRLKVSLIEFKVYLLQIEPKPKNLAL